MSDSTRSVIVNIPRPRVFVKQSVNDIEIKKPKKSYRKAARKPTEGSLKKYSLLGNTPVHTKYFKCNTLLLSHKLYEKKQKSVKLKQHSGIKLHEQYKIINTDLRSRLHVEDPPDDVRAVTDIDEGYFRYLNGHPPMQYIPLYKSLKFEFHERLRTRQEVGYRRDCIVNIKVNHKKELETYKLSVQTYTEQVKQFNEFISEDYKRSMALLKKLEYLEAIVESTISELKHLANTQFTIQSRLIGLDYMYYKQQKYGRFLYYLSPPSWRSKNREFAHSVEIEAKGFDLGTSSEEDTFNAIFEKMQNEFLRGTVKPVLYFSHHDVLMNIFETIEKQELHIFTHIAHLAPHVKTFKNVKTQLKVNIEQDSALVVLLIKDFQKLVSFCEERAAQLQAKFMKILHGLFYDSVSATDVLKLQMHLDFCYEKLYAEKESGMSILLTAKALEETYMNYTFKLDAFTNEKIKTGMKKCVEREEKKLKRAYLAARELRLFDRLEKSLLLTCVKVNDNIQDDNILLTSLPNVKRPTTTIRKLKKSLSKPVVRRSSQRELTEAEIEYLVLFTDWTETENPADYLQSFAMITDENGEANEA